MRAILQEAQTVHTPESLVEAIGPGSGTVLLRSRLFDSAQARYSFVAARPFLSLRTFGARHEFSAGRNAWVQFGDPWAVLEDLMARYELLEDVDLPFPLGGCFGFWGYDLKNFVEPRLERRAVSDLELPESQLGFHDSVVIFDHRLDKTWVVSTGLRVDGSRDPRQARHRLAWWLDTLASEPRPPAPAQTWPAADWTSTMTRAGFVAAVESAQRYIRAGDIYQVNLAHRLAAPAPCPPWEFYRRLSSVSPAPFSGYLDGGDFQLASSSPELFLRLSGRHAVTRPIKGTRPRSSDPTRDAQLSFELQSSAKEMAELLMITDLLRNDLGRVCEYGSVQVPELVRLERYPQVQHLVSTVEGRLWPETTHVAALARCFPGGSITGAPKIRAMEIIDELEPVTRGPYTGCLGYLGFNRESQLSLLIRTAVCTGSRAYFHAGAGIVADSVAEAEYDETLAKASGFLAAVSAQPAGPGESRPAPDPPIGDLNRE